MPYGLCGGFAGGVFWLNRSSVGWRDFAADSPEPTSSSSVTHISRCRQSTVISGSSSPAHPPTKGASLIAPRCPRDRAQSPHPRRDCHPALAEAGRKKGLGHRHCQLMHDKGSAYESDLALGSDGISTDTPCGLALSWVCAPLRRSGRTSTPLRRLYPLNCGVASAMKGCSTSEYRYPS
jgi:hypothetical protein